MRSLDKDTLLRDSRAARRTTEWLTQEDKETGIRETLKTVSETDQVCDGQRWTDMTEWFCSWVCPED